MSVKSDNFFMDSVKDAAAGGLIALALFAVLIGMKAEVASGLGGSSASSTAGELLLLRWPSFSAVVCF